MEEEKRTTSKEKDLYRSDKERKKVTSAEAF